MSIFVFLGLVISSFILFINIEKIIYFYNNFKSISSIVRNFPLLLSCILFIIFKNYFKLKIVNYYLFYSLSILGILVFLSIFLLGSMSDRLLVYILPLYILVFSLLINYFNTTFAKISYIILLNLFIITFFYSWIIFGNSSIAWIPYNILIGFEQQTESLFRPINQLEDAFSVYDCHRYSEDVSKC